MTFRSGLLTATILGLSFAAHAQPVTGLYVGGGVGLNVTQKQNATLTRSPAEGPLPGSLSTSGDLNGSSGFAGVLSVGWGFGNGLRAELEGNYRNNHNSGFSSFQVNVPGGTPSNVAGGSTQQMFGGMVNVLYDFVGLTPWFQPYLGAGVGAVGVSTKYHTYNASSFTIGPVTIPAGAVTSANNGSTTGSFAYQAIVGLAFPLDKITPGLALTTEYRFLGTVGNRSYDGTSGIHTASGAILASSPDAFKLGPSYNHSILVGLRYNFGVAPPPAPAPVAAPAAAPARSYLVFFDWDKATLTDRARQIIKEAADNSTRVQYTRLEVNGYTDTSGTPRYNQGLSVRRAEAVAAELVRDGVPRNAIAIQGFGDTKLLVPTGPGVREPQNRRVEIIIR